MDTPEIRMTGVGCFAGGTTLSRVLRRVVETYSLGDWGGADGARQDSSPAVRALQRLMSAGNRCGRHEDGAQGDETIAGFFLDVKNQEINLSVFTRGRGRQCQKYTTSLEELTRLRRSRLH